MSRWVGGKEGFPYQYGKGEEGGLQAYYAEEERGDNGTHPKGEVQGL